MKYTCIIPVRLASKRFPKKPYADICGQPMLKWVYKHASGSENVNRVIIAAYEKELADYCRGEGMEAIKVSPDCRNGSEAVAFAAQGLNEEWIFEMQGDQPMVTPKIIDNFISKAEQEINQNKGVQVVIPYAKTTPEQTASQDILKVVVTKSGRLVFQTRQPIQTEYRTLGLYLWSRKALKEFASAPISDVEKTEDSHPIRLYVNDVYVQGIEIKDSSWVEVDRPHHIQEVERILVEKGIV